MNLAKENWFIEEGLVDPDCLIEDCSQGGIKLINRGNTPVKVTCNTPVLIDNTEANTLQIDCRGSILSNAGGYILVNGFDVPINGKISMPIIPPVELKVEAVVNANSSLEVFSLIFSGLEDAPPLCDLLNPQSDVLVVTPTYPSYQNLYLSAFAHARNRAYRESGLNIQVASLGNSWYSTTYELDGIPVYRGPGSDLEQLLEKKQYKVIVVHFVDENIYPVLEKCITFERLIFICHGPETLFEVLHNKVRPYDSDPLPERIEHPEKRKLVELFAGKKNVDWVFVSEWLRSESEKVLGIKFRNSRVIGNFINQEIFPYREKSAEDRKKILVIRKFDNVRQHSLDQVAKAIIELSGKDFFEDLHFSFYGDGNYYDQLIEPIKQFQNIEFHRTFLPQQDIARIHAEHGILLLPSRHDAHAVSMSEGASSGLVVIGSNVTSNPYFMDNEHNHTMVDPEDPKALADVIERLYYNPDEFLAISKRLSDYVHSVSSRENTIEREIDLIKTRKNKHHINNFALHMQRLKNRRK